MKKKYDNQIVSVIIPVYNAEKYVEQTILSAINQSYLEIEIIVIDDCSKDNSKKIIEKIATRHSNIVYHLQNVNQGVAVARNRALQLAQGRYVAFLDSDDLWNKYKISIQIKQLNTFNASFSYTAIEMIDDKGNNLKGKRKIKSTITYKELLKNTMIATSSVVIDRNIVGDFQMPLIRSGQDYATWLMLLRSGIDARGVDEALVKYRVANNSLSSNKFKSIEQVWKIQVHQEGIAPIYAGYNTFCFILNALKKYLKK
ncbi:MAG: glycosyltransferase family 2 protein [Bacilli bacterium]